MTTTIDSGSTPVQRVERDFIERTTKSRELWEEARRVMPGGVTRAVAHFEPYPVALARGQGAYLTDVDGNSYVDVLNNYTSLVHGNAHPALAEAAATALSQGGVFPAPHPVQIRHARLLLDRLSNAQRVRYANSGTEAAMLAIRTARALTGREKIAKAWGAYHGTYDAVWTHVGGQGKNERESARQPGVPRAVHDMTVIFDYNDPESVQQIGSEHGEQLAAIIVEPFLAAAGGLPARREFLAACREVCDRYGALLILDEVQTFRLEYGGLQAHFGIKPDLTIVGKWIGGGLPTGAVVGTAEVMEVMVPGSRHFVNHSGTFNGNISGLSAGIIALELLDHPAIARINRVGSGISQAIESSMARLGVLGSVSGYGSLFNLHLGISRPQTVIESSVEDGPSMDLLHLALLVEGVYAAHRGMMNISTAMTDEDAEVVVSATARAIARILGAEARVSAAP